jgi:hypothetical protein
MKKLMMMLGVTSSLLTAPAVSAQIVSQTPRPDVPEPEAASLEILKPEGRIGRTGSTIKIARNGALLFAGFDRNSDYIIDKAEISAGIDRSFNAADVDNSQSVSLVELEGWREKALGSLDAAPHNYAFAPNFARTVSLETFRTVLNKMAESLDKDDEGDMDGKIAISDLLKDHRPRIQKSEDGESCVDRIQQERQRAEQQCRNQRR